jgi:two-component system OmpR family response regulator
MRVLVVEDDPRLSKALVQGLREEGYTVDAATDGPTADLLVHDTDYDAVVLDVMLPGKDGLSLCREWRQRQHMMPVLLLTARDLVSDRVAGLDAGADDYLSKPFAFDELLARLRALIRRSHGQTSGVLTVGDLRLDPATRRVTRGEAEIALTNREFALLRLFMLHPGEVLSRTHLIEHVWGDWTESAANTLEVYVGYVRRKLQDPYGELLQTVRGVGYRLQP